MDTKPAEYLSAREFAERTGHHVNTVRSWLASGRLQAEYEGRAYRIPTSQVDAFRRTVSDELRAASGASLVAENAWSLFSEETDKRMHDLIATIHAFAGWIEEEPDKTNEDWEACVETLRTALRSYDQLESFQVFAIKLRTRAHDTIAAADKIWERKEASPPGMID